MLQLVSARVRFDHVTFGSDVESRRIESNWLGFGVLR